MAGGGKSDSGAKPLHRCEKMWVFVRIFYTLKLERHLFDYRLLLNNSRIIINLSVGKLYILGMSGTSCTLIVCAYFVCKNNQM